MREVTAERQAERLKSELVATVSHELRTPLAGVLGYAELLLSRELDPETQKRYLETIHGQARRLTALLNDFLALQRIESGQFTLRTERVDLAALLRRESEPYAAQSAAHTLELDLPDEPLTVIADPGRVAQIVANLLSNAVKYSPRGGVIRVVGAAHPGLVRVSVADSGIGIPAGQQEQVFEKFFRVDSSDTRDIGGTGLGLAICRDLVEAHGGRIGFESSPGDGSCFWFELPAASRGTGTGRPRALVVEDDPLAAALLAEQLDEHGWAVETEARADTALERVLAEPPELLCVDLHLPGKLDGFELLRRLRAHPATAAIPAIVVTGDDAPDKPEELAVHAYLFKPVVWEQLRAVLDSIRSLGGSAAPDPI